MALGFPHLPVNDHRIRGGLVSVAATLLVTAATGKGEEIKERNINTGSPPFGIKDDTPFTSNHPELD